MSDIFQAVTRRSPVGEANLDITLVDVPLLFPVADDEQAAEFEKLATRVLEFHHSPGGYVLAFASSTGGEGASFVSFNVARLIATTLDRRTIWVDANFLSPHPRLAHIDGATLASYLAEPDLARTSPVRDRLSLLPGGAGLPTMRPELTSDNCRQVFAGLRECYDFVILDCPPILDAVESAWLGTAADGEIVVVEARRLKSRTINHGLQTLARRDVNVLGTVLNKRRYVLPRAVYERL
jgi:Mrp family chromosome partitioning ATPase